MRYPSHHKIDKFYFHFNCRKFVVSEKYRPTYLPTFRFIWQITFSDSVRIITLSRRHRNKYCLKRVPLVTETVLQYSRIVSDSSSIFLKLWEVALHRFSGISEKLLKKNNVMESRFGYDAYLELIQTIRMELFCENSKRVIAINYFHKKSPS